MALHNIIPAILVTLFAGLTTVLGGMAAVFGKKPSRKMLSAALGFSAGLMLYVAFTEVLEEAREYLGQGFPDQMTGFILVAAFFGGMAVVMLINALLPESAHHHHDEDDAHHHEDGLYKTGLFMTVAIGLHNLPEGVALFTTMAVDPALGIPLVLATVLHNVPVGLSIAMPVYAASGSRKKALLMTLAAGIVTPIGAAAALLLVGRWISAALIGVLLAAVAGIMVYVALGELYPCSRETGGEHESVLALGAGMLFIAVLMCIF